MTQKHKAILTAERSVPFMQFKTDISDQTCIFLIEGEHWATYLMIEKKTLDCLGKYNVDLLFDMWNFYVLFSTKKCNWK